VTPACANPERARPGSQNVVGHSVATGYSVGRPDHVVTPHRQLRAPFSDDGPNPHPSSAWPTRFTRALPCGSKATRGRLPSGTAGTERGNEDRPGQRRASGTRRARRCRLWPGRATSPLPGTLAASEGLMGASCRASRRARGVLRQ
jgi:hypothetical protein